MRLKFSLCLQIDLGNFYFSGGSEHRLRRDMQADESCVEWVDMEFSKHFAFCQVFIRKGGFFFFFYNFDILDPVLSSFSIYTNGARLLNTKSTAETMMPLHGLRFLSICWIMLGHRCFFTLFSPILNLIDLVNVSFPTFWAILSHFGQLFRI